MQIKTVWHASMVFFIKEAAILSCLCYYGHGDPWWHHSINVVALWLQLYLTWVSTRHISEVSLSYAFIWNPLCSHSSEHEICRGLQLSNYTKQACCCNANYRAANPPSGETASRKRLESAQSAGGDEHETGNKLEWLFNASFVWFIFKNIVALSNDYLLPEKENSTIVINFYLFIPWLERCYQPVQWCGNHRLPNLGCVQKDLPTGLFSLVWMRKVSW